jgi:hypothetical protein
MSHVSNSVVEILLILTDDLGLTDQTVNNSSFHVMWKFVLEARGPESNLRNKVF